jgi:hypothetical protein
MTLPETKAGHSQGKAPESVVLWNLKAAAKWPQLALGKLADSA